MSGPKNSLKPPPKSAQGACSSSPENKSCECDHALINVQLTAKNAHLALEVQKLRQTNGKLVSRVTELFRKNHEAAADNVRLRESFKRISGCLEKFVPCMVTGTQYLDIIAGELDKASVMQNDIIDSSPVSNDEGLEDINCGGNIPASPLRTGIARPIVQGHTISKPSISLQRVVPRQTASLSVSMPVRSLNLAELVRADDQNRLLNDVTEEEDDENEVTEESEDNETEENLSQPRRGSEEIPSSTNEALELSVVEEEPTMQLSVSVEQSVLSPVVEEQPSSSAAASNRSHKRSRNRSDSPSEEEHVESSDDEAVELSLIEARCKLMNLDRRKELKEGTSKDYDARGNFSPSSRRRRKRQKEREVSPARGENETSALRRSVSGLLNSIKKNRISKNKRSSDADESPASGQVNGFVTEEMATSPRVSLVRISSFKHLMSAETERMDENPPSPGIMVSKRKRVSHVTTRNKRSRRPSLPMEEVVVEEPAPPVEEQPRRSGKKRRRSWTELLRKRSRSQEEADDFEAVTRENSPRPSASSPRPSASSPRPEAGSHNASADDLPTILLSRCSGSFLNRNSCKELSNNSLDDSNSSSDAPLSRLIAPAIPENIVYMKNSPTIPSGKRAKAKPRSKPKPPSKLATKMNVKQSQDKRGSNRSVNGIDHNESKNSLNPNLLNASVASSVGEKDCSVESSGRPSGTGRPRRATAPTSLKEKPLNVKMRRN